MRSFLLALGAAAALLVSTPASAQFANRSIGASAGYLKLNSEGFDWGIPAGLFFNNYLDAGFELTARLHVMFLQEPVRQMTVVGLTPQFGIRYLLAQEHFRPYVGVDVSYLRIIYDPDNASVTKDYAGIGPNIGVDYFVADAWSVGLRGQFNLYVWLNKPTQSSLGATIEVATYY